jgi:hypothetical protein
MDSMNFEDAVANAPVILTEGAVIERLRRDPAVDLDPHIANAGLIYNQIGRNTMAGIYRQYIDIAIKYRLFQKQWESPPLHRNPEFRTV